VLSTWTFTPDKFQCLVLGYLLLIVFSTKYLDIYYLNSQCQVIEFLNIPQFILVDTRSN
jgi:hypothetical protein